MKIRVDRDALSDAVTWVSRTLPQKPQLPMLSGVRLDVAGHELTLSGFDYEVSTEVKVEVSAAEGGQLLVSGRLLAEIVRSLPGQPVEIVSEGPRTVLTCGSTRFTLATMPLDEYPALPAMPEQSGTVGSDAFAAAVGSVAVAAGRDDTLPVMTGIRVEIEGDSLTLAATDRYRLAVRQLRWQPEDPQISTVALIPARTLAEAAKALTTGAHVSLAFAAGGVGEGMVGLAGAGRRLTSRLLDGEYPKYRSLLPAESQATAQLETSTLVDAVKRVSLVASRNSPIRLSFDSEQVVLEAGGLDDAQASEAIPVTYDGEPMTIAFNPGYLLDGLGVLDSDETRMSFTTPSKPTLITGKPVGESDYRYLLMPVRLSG
ncbi:MAG TPA: DNA polymerase III subunit beta [Mycobacteriales bacterium]|nr:DNA polymerase III subunit beta [Mycobacteriales bacterium]